jgi:hypothetical protein
MLKKESIQKKIALHKARYEKALEKNDLDKAEFHAAELDTWETLLLDL